MSHQFFPAVAGTEVHRQGQRDRFRVPPVFSLISLRRGPNTGVNGLSGGERVTRKLQSSHACVNHGPRISPEPRVRGFTHRAAEGTQGSERKNWILLRTETDTDLPSRRRNSGVGPAPESARLKPLCSRRKRMVLKPETGHARSASIAAWTRMVGCKASFESEAQSAGQRGTTTADVQRVSHKKAEACGRTVVHKVWATGRVYKDRFTGLCKK